MALLFLDVKRMPVRGRAADSQKLQPRIFCPRVGHLLDFLGRSAMGEDKGPGELINKARTGQIRSKFNNRKGVEVQAIRVYQ